MQAFEQSLQLTNSVQQNLGAVRIDKKVEQLLIGEFASGPDFSQVEELFQAFEEAVNVQVLGTEQFPALLGQLTAAVWL